MIEPDRDVIDALTEEVVAATRGKTPAESQSCANGILRVALRTLVNFFDRETAGELLRREALDVGISLRSAAVDSPAKARMERTHNVAEEVTAIGFWALCVGAGFLIGFILARALP